jgi:mono/diheme cytochrome c family protein
VRQDVFLRGEGFEASPAVNLPVGLTSVLSWSMFNAATPDAQMTMYEALGTINHPLKVAPDTAPCVACHTSSRLLDMRAPGLDPKDLQSAYVTSYNISIDAGRPSPNSGITLRALGYAGQMPVISRRVAHETAQVLSEIEQRFP